MSAETLRRAAALMRERAEAASWQSHRWETGPDEMRGPASMIVHPYDSDLAVAFTGSDEAAHIASWHPAVALAVADWLDVTERDVGTSSLAYHAALAVARAYLGDHP